MLSNAHRKSARSGPSKSGSRPGSFSHCWISARPRLEPFTRRALSFVPVVEQLGKILVHEDVADTQDTPELTIGKKFAGGREQVVVVEQRSESPTA